MSSYKVTDKNRIPEYIEMLKELRSSVTEIGIFQNAGEHDDGTSILLIANVQEFGCNIKVTEKMRGYLHSQGLHLRNSTKEIKIPERSFIRSGWDNREKRIRDTANKLLKRVLMMEMRTDTFFNTLGDYISEQLKEYMTEVTTPPNHPFTIERKGSSLIGAGASLSEAIRRPMRL